MNEKCDVKDVFDQHLGSLRFQAARRQTVIEKALGKEEPMMKKKMSAAALVFAIVLVALTALATIAVMRSDSVNKLNLAREALYEQYGLTPPVLGMFLYEGEEENGAYTLTWTSNTFHPTLTGVYTTVVKDGKAQASWSYDEVDPSVYDSGEFSAPIWGYKQLEASFQNKEKADEYSLIFYQQDDEKEKTASTSTEPISLKQGERYWQGEIIRAAEPGANDLTREQAYEIAVQVLYEDFGIDKQCLSTGMITDESFHVRENGRTLWDISINVTINDVEHDCVVRIDGETGEVLSVDVLTGGNG